MPSLPISADCRACSPPPSSRLLTLYRTLSLSPPTAVKDCTLRPPVVVFVDVQRLQAGLPFLWFLKVIPLCPSHHSLSFHQVALRLQRLFIVLPVPRRFDTNTPIAYFAPDSRTTHTYSRLSRLFKLSLPQRGCEPCFHTSTCHRCKASVPVLLVRKS